MAYNNWDGNFEVMMCESDSWYSVPDLFRNINHIKKMDVSSVASRQQALQTLNTGCGFPAARDVRFPEHELFIRESDGDWGQKFTQLRAALQYRSRAGEKATEVAMQEVKSGEDNLKSLHSVLDRFVAQLRERYMFVDRAQFERSCRVNWA